MSEQKRQAAVYRQLSADMRQGLKNIYQQISTAATPEGDERPKVTDALFHEASDQLDEVLKATESAAMSIMEIVETQLDRQAESASLIADLRGRYADDAGLERLAAINEGLGVALTSLLTSLSFQDITGQRIKRVVSALNAIERSVVDLYVSSGLVMDAAEKNPAGDARAIQDEARKAVEDFRENRRVTSTLKGPDKNGISQSAIDDMLAQLGL